MSLTRTPPRSLLILANGSYNGRAIMRFAHQLARADVAADGRAAALGLPL